MKVPVFQKTKAVDKDGYFTPQIQQMLDILFQQLQISVSDEGFQIPQQTTANINTIFSPANPNAKGSGIIVYDSDTHQYKGNANGVIKTFTVT